MADHGSLADVFSGMRDQLALLGISGAGGAFFRAVFAPEKEWGRRIVQGVCGAISAIFLGGVLGHLISAILPAEAAPSAFLAAGFLMGVGGEAAVKRMQERLLVRK
jgi:hypothetical protein